MIALKSVRPIVGKCSLLCALLGVAAAGIPASAQTLIPLVSFNGSNGQYPSAALIADGSGNLFGTTENGGAYKDGTVFEIPKTTSGYASTPVTLVSFNYSDGAYPYAALIADGSGDLFGTTAYGGASGVGTVFEIAKTTTTTTGYASTPVPLVSFNGSNGAIPNAALIADGNGNLFGTTVEGGTSNYGTVFEIAKTTSGYASTPVTLVSFTGTDGAYTYAALIADGSGNLFGTTQEGGASGYGTVFEIAKSTTTATGYVSTPVTLVNFNYGNGAYSSATLIADGSGNLFGTTESGGASGDGTVFEIAKSTTTATGYASTPITLVSFNYGDGAVPYSSLIADGSGNLFGTTEYGGASGDGTVFEIAKTTTTTSGYASTPATLVSFNYGDGADPFGGLIADGSGNLFGTTVEGGASGDGTVFEIAGSGFVPVRVFAGTPGSANCVGASTSSLAQTYGGIAHAASALGYNSVSALKSAITTYCSN
jgi:uncharacterized repeat protein (TIGR03803 family)